MSQLLITIGIALTELWISEPVGAAAVKAKVGDPDGVEQDERREIP